MENRIKEVLSYEKTKSEWRGNHLSEEWQKANKLNIELFGISLNKAQKCECIEDLFFALKRPNIVNKIIEKMEKQFHVKKGSVVMSFNADTITEHSTDAQCISALKNNPTLIKFFEKVPDNWQKIVGIKEDIKELSKEIKEVVKEVKKTRAKRKL
ncbi:hypothetical protein UFOVP200_25 [uncultured Caudovirales phage]|uniref:Uncharacterized protein n=1 Tax=uncultured Caudovirales phage TaxID=2100421 RepID=A0A6J7WN42_9CAUD|nr:hypothetical protein UFOVP200_25 [uncultured Caudovirales phage]